LQVVDTTERDRALAELDREKEARRTAELEAAKVRMSQQLVLNECNQLRQELERQRQQLQLIRSELWDSLLSKVCWKCACSVITYLSVCTSVRPGLLKVFVEKLLGCCSGTFYGLYAQQTVSEN